MKKNTIITALIALFVSTASFAASIHYASADGSPAIRVYNGYTGTVSIVITTNGAGNNMSVTLDGLANALDGSGNTDTVAELAAAIAACTNRAGTAALVVDTDCALGTDSTDGELLDGTYTAVAGAWLEIPWDTSAALHYDVYIPDTAAGGVARQTQTKLKSVYGNPGGTGAVSLDVYLDGALAFSKPFIEPAGVSGTNDAAVVISNTVDLQSDVNIPVGTKSILVRATRATTATTGMLGIVLE